jgi:hypothetical protein
MPDSGSVTGVGWCRWRGRLSLAAILLVGLGAATLVMTSCHPRPALYVPAEDLQTLKPIIATQYPDWTIERMDVVGTPSAPLRLEVASVAVLLKWRGPEDMRIAVTYYYSNPGDFLGWGENPDPSMLCFGDRSRSLEFIKAFKAQHPEPGWAVSIGVNSTDPALIRQTADRGLLVKVFANRWENGRPIEGSGVEEGWRVYEALNGYRWTPDR